MRKLLFLLFLFSGFLLPAAAQQKSITGTVTGAEDKLPIIGATVLIKGHLNRSNFRSEWKISDKRPAR
jgi:hypothetical protein